MFNVYCCNNFNKKYDRMYLKLRKDASLFDLRNALETKRNFKCLFFLTSNKNYFSKEEETKIKVFEYFKKKIIYFTDVSNIKINLEGEFFCDINFENISLDKLRLKLKEKLKEKLNHKIKFFYNNAFILDEENFKLFEICKNNIIEMNPISDYLYNKIKENEIKINKVFNKPKKVENIMRLNIQNFNDSENDKLENSFVNHKNEPIKIFSNQAPILKNNKDDINDKGKNSIIINNKNLKRYNSLDPEKRKEKKIRYNFFFDNKKIDDFPFFECCPDDTLKQIREYLPDKYKDYIFLYDGFPVVEETTKVIDIAKKNKIFLKSKNEPKLNNSIKIKRNSIYEYYLYKNSKFNEEEERNCVSILLVGETGTGKTTFLNSLINFILNVNYTNKYRYLLVNNKDSENTFSSQTKEVNIYYIKSHNNYPPIKIIDTPGFGDTSGHEFDRKIAKMIYEKFQEIKELNSICIICKYNEGRFDFSQRYIFNCIIELFGNDMIENFMILFSFCDSGEIISKKCFEGEDSPFFKIINKIKEPWYLKFNNSGFFAEKQNNLIEEIFKMGKESFIKLFSKLKSLKKVKLILSSEVNLKREKLDMLTSFLREQIISLVKLMTSSYTYGEESMKYFYCPECKFFSSSQNCILNNHIIKVDYGNNYFNFNNFSINEDKLFLKSSLEVYSNLFRFENIMQEYNNLTLKCSQETIKDFFLQIGRENEKNMDFNQKINSINMNYEKYRNGYYKQNNIKNDFTTYLFYRFVNKE